MGNWYHALRCKTCGKLYWERPCSLPKYCKKCATEIYTKRQKYADDLAVRMFGGFDRIEIEYTDNVETVLAKKILGFWKVKELN